METTRFDRLTRHLSGAVSRRQTLRIATLGVMGLITAPHLPEVSARKRKPKGLPLNAFGCLDVGARCRGNSANCCSGICLGKKPKKGAKDKSRCVAHDVDVCQVGQDSCDVGIPCTINGAPDGFCFTTTGNAPFCGAGGGTCFECTRDADCIGVCGTNAACVLCPSCLELGPLQTACVAHDQDCNVV
jgi:hypothetical protein